MAQRKRDIMDEVREALQKTDMTVAQLSRETGLAYNTIKAIKVRDGFDPRIGTLREINRALRNESK